MIRIETIELPRAAVSTAALRIHHHWRNEPHTFWLDSACNPERLGRFSFLGTNPYAVVRGSGDEGRCKMHVGAPVAAGRPLDVLAEVAEPIFAMELPEQYAAPFAGGLVGYISYDAGRFWAGLPASAKRDVPLPELVFAAYDCVVCVDHLEQRVYIVSTGLPFTGRAAEKRADERLGWLRQQVTEALHGSPPPGPVADKRAKGEVPSWRAKDGTVAAELRSSVSRDEYLRTVRHVLGLVEAGSIDQVNLSQRFTMQTDLSGPELYYRLREANPAPYAALLHVEEGDGWILSSSPERFVHMRGDHIEMRPIKGTRPRSDDAVANACNRAALLVSPKDAAEHNMIVQLEQTALGAVCEPGSVHVAERMVCEEYATVFHLVSTVAGRLPAGVDRIDCIRRLFPGGSITGQPKLQAMALIDELEPVGRGVYTGSIGYLGVGGNVDLNVAIRTLILQGGRAHFHVGGAIVAGSTPEDEYEETLDKAEGMVRALLAQRS